MNYNMVLKCWFIYFIPMCLGMQFSINQEFELEQVIIEVANITTNINSSFTTAKFLQFMNNLILLINP